MKMLKAFISSGCQLRPQGIISQKALQRTGERILVRRIEIHRSIPPISGKELVLHKRTGQPPRKRFKNRQSKAFIGEMEKTNALAFA